MSESVPVSTSAMAASFAGLGYLATAVVVLDARFVVRYANQAAENLLEAPARRLQVYGFLGILAGPLVVTLLTSFVETYREEFAEK